MRQFNLSILAFLVASATISVRADELAALAPFVNDQTIAVLRVDLKQFDFPAVIKQWLEPMCTTDLERAIFDVVVRQLQQWTQRIKADDLDHFYVVATLAYLPDPAKPAQFGDDWLAGFVSYSLFVVVPGARNKAIDDLHKTIQAQAKFAWPGGNASVYPDCRRIHDAAVIGMGTILDQLAAMQPTIRPEFDKALVAAGGQPVCLAAAPPPIFTRAAEEILRDPLPGADQPLGIIVGRGVRWISVGVEPNLEKLNAQIIVQSVDAESSRNLWDTLQQATKLAATALAKEGENTNALLVGKLESLIPKPEGDRLVLSLNEKATADLRAFVQKVFAETMAETYRNRSQRNLKRIGLAILNHESAHKQMPDRALRDKNGKPLLSWRVAILPYMEEIALYKEFHLDEPWDSEHNRKLIDRMPEVFRSPDTWSQHPGRTRYLAAVGVNLVFPTDHAIQIQEITDGTSKTIMVVEADPDHAVNWTKPDDIEIDLDKPARGLATDKQKFNALFSDGHVETLPGSIKPKILRAMFTRNGGEPFDRGNY